MNKELLKKYCSNSCTAEEIDQVLAWFEKSAGTSEGKSLLLKIWDELPDKEDNLKTNFDILLGSIHHKINLTRSERLLLKADQNLIRYKRRETLFSIFSRAAAILMLPVLGFGLYMSYRYQTVKNVQDTINMAYNEVSSSVDAISKVTLPDGSNIWLNHSSSLRYPSVFQNDIRKVELKGEGYFEVAHDIKKPFIVTAGEIQIKATGTTFNIMAYPEESRIETSLISGHVELQREDMAGNVISLVKMKPTDLAIFKKNSREISTQTINDDRYFSWKDGKLIFNKEPMGEVAKKLARWFNVDIQIKDPELLELTYTATFVHETLPQVLELMAMVSPVKYTISNRKEISPGTFSKRKIVMTHRN
jgi:transmembrane sensor